MLNVFRFCWGGHTADLSDALSFLTNNISQQLSWSSSYHLSFSASAMVPGLWWSSIVHTYIWQEHPMVTCALYFDWLPYQHLLYLDAIEPNITFSYYKINMSMKLKTQIWYVLLFYVIHTSLHITLNPITYNLWFDWYYLINHSKENYFIKPFVYPLSTEYLNNAFHYISYK